MKKKDRRVIHYNPMGNAKKPQCKAAAWFVYFRVSSDTRQVTCKRCLEWLNK